MNGDGANDAKRGMTLFDFLWALIRYFPWLVGVLVILACLASIYVFATYDVAYNDGSFSATPKRRTADWRGWYADVSTETPKGYVYYVAHEDFNLDFYESGKVIGGSRGEVKADGATISKEWRMSGYERGEFLFMTFVTIREDRPRTPPYGIGGYVLQRKGNNYSGYVVFRDSTHNATLQCPYVLTQEFKIDESEAKRRWPQLGDGCKKLVFPSVTPTGAIPDDRPTARP